MQTEEIPVWKKTFGVLSIFGFLFALSVHLLTFFGIEASDYVRGVWLLHLGIFVVIIPIAGNKKDKNAAGIFGREPKWLRYLFGFFTLYTLINFALFIFLSEGGVPHIENGQYFLHSHGKFIRQLTETEYQWHRAYILRGFSGHWMIFYLVAASEYVYYSAKKRTNLFDDPQNKTF